MARRPKQEPGKVSVWHGVIDRDAPDMCSQWMQPATKRHSNLVMGIFNSKNVRFAWTPEEKAKAHNGCIYGPTWAEELEAAGFDMTTLKFSIEMKKDSMTATPPEGLK